MVLIEGTSRLLATGPVIFLRVQQAAADNLGQIGQLHASPFQGQIKARGLGFR
jgi:hypothetical protein